MNGTLDTTSYTYDGLNRLTQKEMEASVGIRIYRQRYAYHTGKSGTNETTGLVKSEELYEGFSTSADEKYEYTYDANGNVTEIKNVFDTGKNISYEYDSLNRLTKETNLAIGSEWRYTYDNGGNITRKEEYNPQREHWCPAETTDTAILTGKTNSQAGAATEQAPLPTTTNRYNKVQRKDS